MLTNVPSSAAHWLSNNKMGSERGSSSRASLPLLSEAGSSWSMRRRLPHVGKWFPCHVPVTPGSCCHFPFTSVYYRHLVCDFKKQSAAALQYGLRACGTGHSVSLNAFLNLKCAVYMVPIADNICFFLAARQQPSPFTLPLPWSWARLQCQLLLPIGALCWRSLPHRPV